MRKWVILGAILGIFHNLVYLGLASGFNLSTDLTIEGVRALQLQLTPLMVLFTAFLIPILEEIIFRLPVVAVFRFSNNNYLRFVVFAAQLTAFAAVHVPKGGWAAASAAVFGAIGGFMAARTGSLYPSIYYHVAQDLTVVAVVVLTLLSA